MRICMVIISKYVQHIVPSSYAEIIYLRGMGTFRRPTKLLCTKLAKKLQRSIVWHRKNIVLCVPRTCTLNFEV